MYQNFGKKITGQIDPLLRRRYIFSGIVVPMLLAAFLAFAAMQDSTMIIKHSVNIMLLSAGWHYAKQGFGILIVTSAYKKVFYTAPERKFLLANAHLMWIFAWILFNTGSKEKEYFGITFSTLGFPNVVAQVLGGLVVLSTAALVLVFLKKRRKDGMLPLNGVTAYVASTYLWIILRFGMGYDNPIHPIVFLIPAMHSIQYITIVMRMKGNQVLQNQMSRASFVVFILGGIVIGALLFQVLPSLLDKGSFYNKAVYGPTLFMFMFWIFINIHHYFIDNVIWRREGAEPKKFLFTVH